MSRCSVILLVTLLFMLSASSAASQTFCSADVGYEWQSGDKGEEALKVHRSRIEAGGADEAAAKAALANRAVEAKAEALSACRKEHENLSGCLSIKLAAASSTLKSLDFTARKSLEDAINSDCKASSGVCKAAYASEPACRTASPPPEEGKKGKEDEKKKK